MDPNWAANMAMEACGGLVILIAGWIAHSLSRLTDGVERLNEKLAHVVAKVETHGVRITNLEKESYKEEG